MERTGPCLPPFLHTWSGRRIKARIDFCESDGSASVVAPYGREIGGAAQYAARISVAAVYSEEELSVEEGGRLDAEHRVFRIQHMPPDQIEVGVVFMHVIAALGRGEVRPQVALVARRVTEGG